MKEDFLHYVWKFQKFDTQNLKLTNGCSLAVLDPGTVNTNAGPDFFNGSIRIDEQEWAGNIEIHINASHWYAHGHDTDKHYDSVILHVVWDSDIPVLRSNHTEIPTLELRTLVAAQSLAKYQRLFLKTGGWIPCEKGFHRVPEPHYAIWLERLYIERLQQKTTLIHQELQRSQGDWEGVLFRLICKNFGLKVNALSFYSLSCSMDFRIVRKCSHDRVLLEALFFGQAGLLDGSRGDPYFIELKSKYAYLRLKFGLNSDYVIPPKLLRLRPSGFPSIRLSQLAGLYSGCGSLFSKVIEATTIQELHRLLYCTAAAYWNTHYTFGRQSGNSVKGLSKEFTNLLLVNTIIPVKFAFLKMTNGPAAAVTSLATNIEPEKNSIIKKFNALRPGIKNAAETQALLQLKKHYCDKRKCMECSLGLRLLGTGE